MLLAEKHEARTSKNGLKGWVSSPHAGWLDVIPSDDRKTPLDARLESGALVFLVAGGVTATRHGGIASCRTR
jgi:hypothetical protein